MKVLLTGAIRVGKSTIINRFLEQTSIAAGGFRTCWLADGHGDEDLLLLPLTADCSMNLANRVAHRSSSSLTVYPEIFDQTGPTLLAAALKCPLLVMDELGFIESRSPDFQSAVIRVLDSPVAVLGVIRDRATPFLDAIRSRADVVILTVTPDNRDEILNQLLVLFEELIK